VTVADVVKSLPVPANRASQVCAVGRAETCSLEISVAHVRIGGPLRLFAGGYLADLVELGYALRTAQVELPIRRVDTPRAGNGFRGVWHPYRYQAPYYPYPVSEHQGSRAWGVRENTEPANTPRGYSR
jgi:hypothetical protein